MVRVASVRQLPFDQTRWNTYHHAQWCCFAGGTRVLESRRLVRMPPDGHSQSNETSEPSAATRRAPRSTLRHALLGLLAAGPKNGLALKRRFDETAGYAWSAKHPQIYRELKVMLADGLIEHVGSGPRGKKLYSVTQRGLDQLRLWLIRSTPDRTVRNEALLRSFFLWLLQPDDSHAHLVGEAAFHRQQLTTFESLAQQVDATPSDEPAARFARIALEYGLRSEQMALDWSEWARTRLLSLTPAGSGPLAQDLARKTAPGRLELVQEFLNTGPMAGYRREQFRSEMDLRRWLLEHGLIGEADGLSASDNGRAISVREALRELAGVNRGGTLSADSKEILLHTSSAAHLHLAFGERHEFVMRGGATGIFGAFGTLLAIVHEAMLKQTWIRLKTCLGCSYAYFDTSDGADQVWCSDLACGRASAIVSAARSG